MRYTYEEPIYQATYLARPNRFVAEVDLNGQLVEAHVKNTGRMTELLEPGNPCWIQGGKNPQRRTRYDLITILADGVYVNLDSQAPNQVIAGAF